MSQPLTLLRTAELLGWYRHVELVCFTRLGARAPHLGHPELAAYLAGAARSHAYRAGLLEQLLPVSIGLPGATELTVSPDARLDAVLEALVTEEEEALVGDLVGTLYPSMLAAYNDHLARCSPIADPPVQRALLRIVADLAARAEEGDALLDGDRAARSLDFVRALEGVGGAFSGRTHQI